VSAPAPLAAEAPAPQADVLRVLVVDDNASVLRFLAAAFGASACVVSQASTAEQALGLLRGERFDLVVSDIKMPGLSGLDLLRAVKGRQPGTPVVLITGAPSVSSAVFGLRYGAYDYLPKPFSVKEIHELLERLRSDRREGRSQGFPAGLTEELERRQFGVEVLFRIGELALGGLDPSTFIETVLGYTMQSLRAAAALIIVREEDGTFKATRRGHPVLLGELSSALPGAFESLLATGGREARSLGGTPGLAAIAALVPGLGNSMGVLCLAREAKAGAFLPDEQELLLGYARTTAVALQKILLRESLEQNLVDTIAAFVNAIESKDVYLKGHSARVSLYAGEIGAAMAMSQADVLVLGRAGMLHDLGKLVMLDSILSKPGKLTPEEYGLIQMHPGVGDRILQPLRFLVRESRAVRHHHERYDGRGYPDGLRGEAIPLLARVVTVADAFDAMTSDRPYRAAMPLAAAREELLRVSGTQVDPKVVAAFAAIPVSRLGEISARYLERRGTVGNPAPLAEEDDRQLSRSDEAPRAERELVVCAQAEAVIGV
jgi:response regulator RpfG family c-di-GMP phosphodiesterase